MEIEHERHGRIRVTPHVCFLIEKDRREAVPQRTSEWYAKRRRHLTASQIAAACGENPYETRLSCLRKKLGAEPPFTGNSATEHGNRYEAEAVEKYERMTGEKVLEFGLLESINEGEEFLAGSPDGITASGRLIEVKCPFRRRPNGEIPKYYVHQIQTLMHILRLPVCDFVEYVPAGVWTEEVFTIVTVTRSELWWATKFPLMRRFWDEVCHSSREGFPEATLQTRKKRRVLDMKVCMIVPESEETREGPWNLPDSFVVAVEAAM